MKWYKALFSAFGGMGGVYGCLELGRMIIWHWTHISFHIGFLLELFLLTIGGIWAILAVIDILFIPSDLLSLGLKGKGLIERKGKYIKEKD